MKRTRVVLTVILMLCVSLFWSLPASAATDSVYTLAETTAAWDGTDANRLKAATADYTYAYGDESSVTYVLPWAFTFYGQAYNQLTADSNGNIWLTASGSAHSFNLANAGRGPVIAAWNNDLSSQYYGGVFIQHKTNPERVVVQWQTETYTEEGEHRLNDVEAVLFPDGTVRLDYRTFDTSNGSDYGSGISKDDGTHFLSLTTAFGNVATLAGRSFVSTLTVGDTIIPTVSEFTIPATSASLTIPITLFTATDNIAVTGHLITESSTPPLSGATGWTVTAPASYTAATAGSHTLYPWAKDAAGNVSALFATPRTVAIDTTAPTGTITINAGAAATNSTAATLTLACSDTNGCSLMQFSNDNITWFSSETYATSKAWPLTTVDGTKTVYVKYKDTSGNWSVVINDTIILDTAVPATSAAPVGGTYTGAQSVTLTCSDGTGSGCDKIYYTTDGTTPTTASSVYAAPLSIPATSTLKYFATDKAGNPEAVQSQTYTII
jgi:Chitobiase/beta-hexosaminidase C-terminal domain